MVDLFTIDFTFNGRRYSGSVELENNLSDDEIIHRIEMLCQCGARSYWKLKFGEEEYERRADN